MKKLFTLTLAIAMTLSLASCGESPTPSPSSPATAPSSPATAPSSQSAGEPSDNTPTSSVGAEDMHSEEQDTNSEGEDPIVNTATLEDFEKHPADAEHMKPITEDYSYYQTTHLLDDMVLLQQIHSYDEEGNCCGDAIKTVYSSEAAAKSQYDKPMYDAIRSNLTLDGAVLYQLGEDGCGNRKLDDLEQFHWWQKYGNDMEKMLLSKPNAESIVANRQYIGEYTSGDNTLTITADTIILIFDGVEYRAGYTTDEIDTSGGISAITFHAGGSEVFVGVGTDFSVAEVYIDYEKGAAFTRNAD